MSGILDSIRDCGVIGCGGAGFPTHAKLNAKIDHLIINGVECEPILDTDKYIERNFSDRLITAAMAIKSELNILSLTFALKADYVREAEALNASIAKLGADVVLHELESFYPAGDEQVLVYEVTGRVVPPAGIPIQVGCAVMNAATLLCAADALEGRPFTHKYLTVSGLVSTPSVLHVPMGMTVGECIELCGGIQCDCADAADDIHIVLGGPMMGKRFTMEEGKRQLITKTTSGILVLPGLNASADKSIELRGIFSRAKAACIQCSLCTQMCPRHLLGHPLEPHKIMRRLAYSQGVDAVLDDPVIRSAALCSECGLCEVYACPMQLSPRRVNAYIKRRLAQEKIRYPQGQESTVPSTERSMRKAPTLRVAARAGVYELAHAKTVKFLEVSADKVRLPLKQSIGAPSRPVVSVGDTVSEGQLIAAIPDGALGSALHASIAGRVTEVSDCIVIER